MNIDPQYLDFKTDGLIENKATPFYCKHVAIIGHLDNFDDIEELASLLWQHGATVSSHVTPYTDIVINGIDADEEDMLLIRQMQANGANLKVYFQEDFECMLSEYHLLDWYSGGTPTIEKKSGKECSKSQNLDRIVIKKKKRESNTQETNTEPIKDESNDKLQETIKKLGEIFPDAVKDGEVDFDKLKKAVDKNEVVLPVKESIIMPLNNIEHEVKEPTPHQTQREILAERRHQRRLERERQQRSYEERMEREAREAEEAASKEQQKKIFAAVGAVIITLVLIYFFGLLGPAVLGLLAGGILAKK